jgi:hypothetical protein
MLASHLCSRSLQLRRKDLRLLPLRVEAVTARPILNTLEKTCHVQWCC